jgi:hypothetical protein
VTETPTYDRAKKQLRERIRDVWAERPLYIDEIIEPGLTEKQITAVEKASSETRKTGLTHFLAVVPGFSSAEDDEWARFTSDLAFTMHESTGEKQTLVLFSQGDGGARSFAYLVTDNGPVIPPAAPQLLRSKSDDSLPVELAVPHYLQVLVAAAEGTTPPEIPDFRTREVGATSEDCIDRLDSESGSPDLLVFGVTAAAALGAGLWLLRRRERYSWRSELTTQPELVRAQHLIAASAHVAAPLSEPAYPDEQTWELYDRGRRIQDALAALITAHPD